MDYKWIGLPQIALPFVNQFSVMGTRPELNLPAAGRTILNTQNFSPSKAPTSDNRTGNSTNTPPAPTTSTLFSKELAAFYIIRNAKVYVIEYNAPEDKFNYYVPTVREMINSFGFLH
jgi:hypothetical protein